MNMQCNAPKIELSLQNTYTT